MYPRFEDEDIKVLERNGNLVYIEFENGETDWVGNWEIE